MASSPKSKTHPTSGSASYSTQPSLWPARIEKIDLLALRSVHLFIQQAFCSISPAGTIEYQRQHLSIQRNTESVVNIQIVQTLRAVAVFTFLYRTI